MPSTIKWIFFLQKLKKSKIKTKTTIQNMYGVKIAKQFPLQIPATGSCLIKNFQNSDYLQNASIPGLCKKTLFFSYHLKPKKYKTLKAHSSQGSFSVKSRDCTTL